MATDVKILAKAKKLYESGLSLREVAKKVGISYQTVAFHRKGEQWVKNAIKSKLEQTEEENLLKTAARYGVTKGRVCSKIDQLLDAKTEIYKNKEWIEVEDYPTQRDGVKFAIEILGLKTENLNVNTDIDEYQILVSRLRGGK